MRRISGSPTPRLALRLSTVSLVAIGLGACSSETMRFSENPFSSPFQTAQSSPRDPVTTGSIGRSASAPVRAQPVTSISSQPLPPPQSAVALRTPSQPVVTAQARVVSTPRFNAPAPSVAGSAAGWTAQGGTPIVMAQGETLDMISSRYGVPRAALISANGLSSPNVAPGTRLTIPVYNAVGSSTAAQPVRMAQAEPPAPVVSDARPAAPRLNEPVRNQPIRTAAATPPQRPAAETAAQRQAKLAEARAAATAKAAEDKAKAEADARAMREARARFAAEAKAKADARTKTAAVAPARTPAAAPPPAPAKPAKPVVAQKPTPAPTAAPARPVVVASAPPAQREVRRIETAPPRAPEPVQPAPVADPQTTASIPKTEPQSERADFRWPARGRVIAGYSGKGGNEGINIAVPEGTPVKAAEGGVVAYAGNELKGYGNLVLIRHPNGYVSAYAHNGELNVKRGETVKRGQVVAKAGQTGNVNSPQLHFEIRKGATPVDPTPYLSN